MRLSDKIRNKNSKLFWAIISLALILRVIPLAWDNHPPVSDGVMYQQLAQSLLNKGSYGYADGSLAAYWPPGYPLMLAGLDSIGFDLAGIKLFQIFLGLLTVWLTMLLGFRLSGTKAGLWSGLLMAIHPYHILYSNFILSETLFVTLYILGLLLYVGILGNASSVRAMLLGLITGASILVRPFFILLPIFYLWLSPRRLKPLFLALLIALLVIIPWTYRNYKVFGQLIPVSSNSGINFWIGHNAGTTGGFMSAEKMPEYILKANENEQSSLAFKEGLSYAINHPAQELWHCCLKIWWLFMPDYGVLLWSGNTDTNNRKFIWAAVLFSLYPLILTLVGLLTLPGLKYWFIWRLLLIYIVGVCLIFFSQPRYLLPFTPILTVSTASIIAKEKPFAAFISTTKKSRAMVIFVLFNIVGIGYWMLNFLLKH